MQSRLNPAILLPLALMAFSACSNADQAENRADSTGQPVPSDSPAVPFNAGWPSTTEVAPAETPSSRMVSDSLQAGRVSAITRAVDRASPAIVNITVTERVQRRRSLFDEDVFRYFFYGYDLPQEYTSIGSGFIISSDGLVVTNQHVIGSSPSTVHVTLTDGTRYQAEVVGSDELTDIALLRIVQPDADAPQGFPWLEFSDSDQVYVGEWAIALGNTFGLFEDGQPTVTVGVVSAKNRDFRPDPSNPRVYIDMIQTDAAINRGNSGGPLLNSLGQVVGINTFIYTGGTGTGFVGLGFAIPSNRIRMILQQLLSSGEVKFGFDTGMRTTSMTEQLVYRYSLPAIQGLLVTEVNRDGPAFDSGIMPGDIILRIGDERVVSQIHADALLRRYTRGDSLKVELIRNGSRYEASMLLRDSIPAETSP